MKDLELFASCLAGLEALLAQELRQLGIKRLRPLSGGVAFFCDLRSALSACLWSRLASRILVVLGRVSAENEALLYEGVRNLVWEDIIAPDASMAIRAHGINDKLHNTHFSALKVKDAICDRLRAVRGERPEIDTFDPGALINVRIREQKATISFDLSGDSLYQRCYLLPDDGPEGVVSCAVAAGLLTQMNWRKYADQGGAFVDPVCGEGFLLVEAASLACDRAPGLTRENWGFFGWQQSDPTIWNNLIEAADKRFEVGLARVVGSKDGAALSPDAPPDPDSVRFIGLSLSSPAIARARIHAKRGGFRQALSIELSHSQSAKQVVDRASQAATKALSSTLNSATNAPVPLAVASMLSVGVLCASPAHAQANQTDFIQCALAAPAASVFGLAGGGDIEDRFGRKPLEKMIWGVKNIATEIRIFDQPPAHTTSLMLPPSTHGTSQSIEVLEPASEQFVARLHKIARQRRKWAKRYNVHCYRVYDADLPDYAVAIDVYPGAGKAAGNRYLHIAEYAAPSSIDKKKASRRFNDVLTLAPLILDVRPDHVFSKVRTHDKGGAQYSLSARHPYITHVQEGGYLFEIDLASHLDTGLFLDHRLTRELIGTQAKGKRFLNLFAYTGSASVYAAGGGARSTTTVDLSQTYLDWAARNMTENGFTEDVHRFERGDVMQWITKARRSGMRYDFIFVDPPTFSNSKAMGKHTWDVQRDHVELLVGITRLLSEEGQALFSCNLRSFKPDHKTLARYGVDLEDITAQTIPEDFRRNPRIHSCFRVFRKQTHHVSPKSQ